MIDRQIKQELAEDLKGQFMAFHALALIKTVISKPADGADMDAAASKMVAEQGKDAAVWAEKFMDKIEAAYAARVAA